MRKRKDQFMLAVLIPLIIMLGLLGVVITIKTTSQSTELRSQASSNERTLKAWTFDDNTLQGWIGKNFPKQPRVSHGQIEAYIPTKTNPVPYLQKSSLSLTVPPNGQTHLIMRVMFGPQPVITGQHDSQIMQETSDSGNTSAYNGNRMRLEYKLKNKTNFELPIDVPISSWSPFTDVDFLLPARSNQTRWGKNAGYILETLRISMIMPKSLGSMVIIDSISLVNNTIPTNTPTPTTTAASIQPKCEPHKESQYVWKQNGAIVLEGGSPISCKQGDYSICQAIGTKSEGWYSSATGGKIIWTTCGNMVIPSQQPSPQLIYCDSGSGCPHGMTCITPAPCPKDRDGRPTTCSFRPYCKANPSPSLGHTPPARCLSGWQCGSVCADTATMDMFNGTWCDGKARWNYEASRKLGIDCGGNESTLIKNGCPSPTPQTYTCPETEWIGCMPGPETPDLRCNQAYLDWATTNCPGFKGAAW